MGYGLRLHALRSIDQQQCAVAGCQRARHFVGKIDMPRCVYDIELVGVAVLGGVVQAHCSGFYGYASLAFQFKAVEHKFAGGYLAVRSPAQLDHAVGKRRFAVVYMGYYG